MVQSDPVNKRVHNLDHIAAGEVDNLDLNSEAREPVALGRIWKAKIVLESSLKVAMGDFQWP